jgi:hypothetical protein
MQDCHARVCQLLIDPMRAEVSTQPTAARLHLLPLVWIQSSKHSEAQLRKCCTPGLSFVHICRQCRTRLSIPPFVTTIRKQAYPRLRYDYYDAPTRLTWI